MRDTLDCFDWIAIVLPVNAESKWLVKLQALHSLKILET